MRRFRLTFGRKLALLYAVIFAGSYYMTHTLGFTVIKNRVLAEILSNPDLDASVVPGRIRYYFNLLDATFYLMAVVLGLAFILIYVINIVPLRRLCQAAKSFSVSRSNPPVLLHSHDEYQDLANALNLIGKDLNNFDEYQRAFISNISHDFRSPLTSIRGYAQIGRAHV